MPKKAKDVRKGTRDHCAHCGEVIELTDKYENRSNPNAYLTWKHIETSEIQCEGSDQKATSRTYCGERSGSSSWYTNLCNRQIKDPDRLMCGVHAAAARKREERTKKMEQDMDLDDYIREEIGKIAKTIHDEHGLKIKAEFDGKNYRYTGNIVMDPNDLIAFLNRFTDESEWEEFDG